MDDVKAHVARAHFPQNRIEVRPVVIEETARCVDDARHLLDAPFEHSECRGVGEHDARGIWPHRRFERREIDVSRGIHRDFPHDTATHGRGGRVGTVRRFRDDDFITGEIATGAVIGANHRHASEFPVRARHRAQRDGLHTRHFLQHLLQFVHAGEKALAVSLRPERMSAQELGQHGVLITGLRVVFHRARPERVEVRVDREVELRQACEVTHGLQLAHFGQQRLLGTPQPGRNIRRGGRTGILRPLVGSATAGVRVFEDHFFMGTHHVFVL